MLNREVMPVFDRSALMEQLGGDEQLAREIVDLFLRDCPLQLSAIRTALDAGDTREVYVVAHTLKGAASTLAAAEVAQAAHTLERICRDGQAHGSVDAWQVLETAAARLLEALRAAEFPDRGTA
jgi:HPt (histidine-containing phosphotransfer) domain-containing protein